MLIGSLLWQASLFAAPSVNDDELMLSRRFFEKSTKTEEFERDIFKVYDEKNNLMGYFALSKNLLTVDGYSGKVDLAVAVDSEFKIVDIILLDNKETFKPLIDSVRYTESWIGMPLFQASFMTVDMISGATVSCHAITNSVQEVCKYLDSILHNLPEKEYKLIVYKNRRNLLYTLMVGVLIMALISFLLHRK